MSWLLTSDLHLTDRPRDSYRFGLFPWLAKQQTTDVAATFILGDLTDRKDNHSASLVNQTIEGLLKLRPPVYILKGNHDYVDHKNPFFKFLSNIDGIHFINEGTLIKNQWVYMIPHQPDQASFDREVKKAAPEAALMVHQTFDGAKGENGSRLSGLRASAMQSVTPVMVYSGDVHTPQTLNCEPMVTYIGSPYHIKFGDDFHPRVWLAKGIVGPYGAYTPLHFRTVSKRMIRVKAHSGTDHVFAGDFFPGDHVKIMVHIQREQIMDWPIIKKNVVANAKKMQLEVFGIEMDVEGHAPQRVRARTQATDLKSIYKAFCKNEDIPDNIAKAGEDLLK